MWEGDPVGVDPKRPLLGFALVAVLCVVLMSLSVGRGWSFDFLQPGKPIASSMGGHVERVPAPARDAAEPVEVGFPVELSTQPLAVPPHAGKAVAKKAKAEREPAEPATTSDDTVVADQAPDDATDRAEARAERAAARAERKLARLEARAQRKADRAALHLQRQVEKSVARAEREALEAAEQAARDADKAAAAAARDAEKAAKVAGLL